MVTLLSEDTPLTKINRGFSFLAERCCSFSQCCSRLLKAAVPNGYNLEGVLFIRGMDQRVVSKAPIKEDEDPLSGWNLIKNKQDHGYYLRRAQLTAV